MGWARRRVPHNPVSARFLHLGDAAHTFDEEMETRMRAKDEVKSFVLKNGDRYMIYRGSNIRTYDTLPKGVYRTQTDPFGNISLTVAEDFVLPDKIYGAVKARARRILDTYENRPTSTGVLLSGEKGSGKTMLVKYISMEALEKGYTTIIADGDAVGSGAFISFIESLVEPAVIVMDEFEKMFEHNDAQNHLLSLFDGVSQGKKLYLLTANDDRKINDYFKARPGRLFYNFHYDKLELDIVKEVIADYEVPESFANKLIDYVESCDTFNFDSLMAIVEEWARYGLEFEETIEGLNIVQKPHYYWEDAYDIKAHTEGQSKPVVVAVDHKLNLKNGQHLTFNSVTYQNMMKNPDNDPKDVHAFVKALTRGQADSEKSLKKHFDEEGYESIYLAQKGKIGQQGNQELFRDLGSTDRNIIYILEKREVVYNSYAGHTW
jgi:hypothetical protein